MAQNPNRPRLDQYRVGSIIEYNVDDFAMQGYYQIIRIDKLKNAPMTFAVHFWKVGTPEPRDITQTPWNGAHILNRMIEDGTMKVVSY